MVTYEHLIISFYANTISSITYIIVLLKQLVHFLCAQDSCTDPDIFVRGWGGGNPGNEKVLTFFYNPPSPLLNTDEMLLNPPFHQTVSSLFNLQAQVHFNLEIRIYEAVYPLICIMSNPRVIVSN